MLTCICDTVAKAPVMGLKQFNCIYGCPLCDSPCMANVSRNEARTGMCDIALEAERTGISGQGILDFSLLSQLTGR